MIENQHCTLGCEVTPALNDGFRIHILYADENVLKFHQEHNDEPLPKNYETISSEEFERLCKAAEEAKNVSKFDVVMNHDGTIDCTVDNIQHRFTRRDKGNSNSIAYRCRQNHQPNVRCNQSAIIHTTNGRHQLELTHAPKLIEKKSKTCQWL